VRRVRRAIAETVKTLAAILVYLGATGTLALASFYVIATTADLKCEVCRDPAGVLGFAPKLEAPAPLALRGALSGG
jgi:hypothetical protein